MPTLPSTIGIPRITFGKRKARSVMVDLYTDDGRLVEIEIAAEYACMIDDDLRLAWMIDSENQYLHPDGTWRQVLSEKSMIPMCMRKVNVFTDGEHDEEDVEQLCKDVFKLAADDVVNDQFRKAARNAALEKLQWIVSIICGTMLCLGVMMWLS